MDIWQFWLGIGIILALLGVIVAILVKKHRNKHRINALQRNLDDLERSFKFLCEEMETRFDYQALINKCLKSIKTITISENDDKKFDELL